METSREDDNKSPEERLREFLGKMQSMYANEPWSREIPLFHAASHGYDGEVQRLLTEGASIAQRDKEGKTALFHAGSPGVVQMLASAGVDLLAVDADGNDSLDSCLEQLIEGAEDPTQTLSICKAMLDIGVPLMHNDRWGSSRLYHVAFAENPRAVRFLLEMNHPIDADARPTPLHAICWHWDYGDERDEGTRDIVRDLLAAGIRPDARNKEGNTPLHEALSGDGSNLVAAEELLAAGADINAINNEGQTALLLHYETLFDYERVVPFMLERGANPLIADHRGQTVLDAAHRMISGGEPSWRTEQFKERGRPPCGWKSPAEPHDAEYRILSLLQESARRWKSR